MDHATWRTIMPTGPVRTAGWREGLLVLLVLAGCGGSKGPDDLRADLPMSFPDLYRPADPGEEPADDAPSAEETGDVDAPAPTDPGKEDPGPGQDAADPGSLDEGQDPGGVDLGPQDPGPQDPGSQDPGPDAGCTVNGCPGGQTCQNHVCMDCLFNFACGPECVACTGDTPLCLSGECVECRLNSDCEGRGWCRSNVCTPCAIDDPMHCGAECATCSGTTPACTSGTCTCTPTSCGTESCVDGACRTCEADDACGPLCAPCAAPTPRCRAGACAECLTDLDCGEGRWCNGGTCTACGDDPGHCGPACLACPASTPACADATCHCTTSSCGTGRLCVDGSCVGCTTDDKCGPRCQACAAPTPFCRNGETCAQCRTDSDCPPGWTCGADGACIDPCQGTPGCTTDLKSTNGEKCSTAWVIGRQDLGAGVLLHGNTTGRKNDDDTPSFFGPDCWDAQGDDAYKVWMTAGDTLTVTATPLSDTFTLSLKLYRGTSCAGNWKADLITCQWKAGDGNPETYTWVATADGWVSIVVDGARAFEEDKDWGPYSLAAKLTCGGSRCCCL